jgi:hypothetical protein
MSNVNILKHQACFLIIFIKCYIFVQTNTDMGVFVYCENQNPSVYIDIFTFIFNSVVTAAK